MLRFRLYFYIFSFSLIILSIFSLAIFRLPLGTDFLGGSLMEIQFQGSRPDEQAVRAALGQDNLPELTLQNIGTDGTPSGTSGTSGTSSMILRFGEVSEEVHQKILEHVRALAKDGQTVEERRFDSIGPAIGQETRKLALWATALVLAGILMYVSWAFRKVSYPMRSLQYAIIVLATLFHDLIITIGLFALLAKFFPLEVGVPFVAAALTTLGYSVNDTIVVFDRIRENLARQVAHFSFQEVANASVAQTFVRSFNSSLTPILVLCAVLVLGGETLRSFIVTLIIGIAIGTYSSIFIASPLLVTWHDWSSRRMNQKRQRRTVR